MRKSMGACKIVTSCWPGAMKASGLPKCFIYNSPGEDCYLSAMRMSLCVAYHESGEIYIVSI
jgi:hypothetical protein